MKSICISIILLFSILAFSSKSYAQDEFPVLEGPYLGQKPPGSIAEIFAPGIVTSEKYSEVEGMFTPDMKSFYFVKCDGKAYETCHLDRFQNKNNRWIKSTVGYELTEPSFSPDGKILHLKNKYMEQTNSGWSEVKSLDMPFKDIQIMRLSVSSKGTYFFDTYKRGANVPIRYSRLIDGKHEAPRVLNNEINTGTANRHPFIAPDESYLIWDAVRENGYGKRDLYISFRQKDNSWGAAINLGDKINTENEEMFASVTSDGKYLFFDRRTSTSESADIYWVDAQIIETLRPK